MNLKRLSSSFLAILAAAALLLTSACHRHSHGEDAHDDEHLAVTVWSDRSELFMEYDPPVAGEEAEFLIHLTRLSDFKPVTAGELRMTFIPRSGPPLEVLVPAPMRPGIYKAHVALPAAGSYGLMLRLSGEGFADEIVAPEIVVTAVGEEPLIPEGDEGEISFLKEQQWVVDFMVKPPSRRSLSVGFSIPGEFVPASGAEATVAAPLPGILSVARSLPYLGQRLSKGDVIAVIDPSAAQQGGFAQLEAEYAQARSRLKLAESEFERAKRLVEGKIAPLRRLEEAQADLESARAALAPLEQAMAMLKGGEAGRVAVRAPIDGTVVEVATGNGRGISAGEPIVRLVNTTRVWRRANVPAAEAGRIEAARAGGTTFRVSGLEGEISPSRLVSTGALIDAQSRTLPVLFEVENGGGLLKVGMYATAVIRTGTVEDALTLPRQALFEDEGRWFVFVQKSGESFERREVRLGAEDREYVQILHGLKESERVVTEGAYYVKLASVSLGSVDAHHGHSH
jgi:membrane fusion protein, heavy metal efflux system